MAAGTGRTIVSAVVSLSGNAVLDLSVYIRHKLVHILLSNSKCIVYGILGDFISCMDKMDISSDESMD